LGGGESGFGKGYGRLGQGFHNLSPLILSSTPVALRLESFQQSIPDPFQLIFN
jgi:hypothetical protein